ncbi:MAG: peptidogalycan biosysnthesis protein [bacterium]|jgi:hypothetical protein
MIEPSDPALRIEAHATLGSIDAAAWNRLAGEQRVGAMPLHLETHSYGEYVFDRAWVDACRRSGLSCFPKLPCAAPFIPVGGLRLLAESDAGMATRRTCRRSSSCRWRRPGRSRSC